MCKLMRLTPEMEREYLDYMEEWYRSGKDVVPMSSDCKELTYAQYLESLRALEHEETCPQNFVPGTTWFYVNDAGRILGAVNLRHRLNEYLLNCGGHIGYGVRPSERRKGYASAMLALALEESGKLGLTRVLVTCDRENIASARTIQKNGGVLENEVPEDDRITQRYWIALN